MLRTLISFSLRHWLALALITSAAMLAIAHAFQTFGGLAPCHLCLQQREVYWVAMPVALAGILAGRIPSLAKYDFLFGWALAAIFLVGTAIAVRHAGAEWKFWSAPEGCTGVHRAIVGDPLALLKAAKGPPRCDVAAWRFLGVSMAGWNALISLKLTGWSAAYGVWRRRQA